MTLALRWSRSGYELCDPSSRQRPLRVDFTSARLRHRVTAGGRELLAKAVGIRPGLRVLDCTAGLGVDSFILASRGCVVDLVERSHTLWLMLEDALLRAADSDAASIVERMELHRGDARYLMSRIQTPDVILIDPMFPSRKKQAEVKGELQRLQKLIGKDEDTRGLIEAARSVRCQRVVVKRPLLGGEIEGLVPSHVIKGKASRYDVFT